MEPWQHAKLKEMVETDGVPVAQALLSLLGGGKQAPSLNRHELERQREDADSPLHPWDRRRLEEDSRRRGQDSFERRL